jgi:predicted outer membrane repeat protein
METGMHAWGMVWWLALAAEARTLAVSADGSTAYASIQVAVDAADDGDLVEVGPGTYAESVDLRGKAITLRSTDGAAATAIDPDGAATWALLLVTGEGPGTLVEGFTVRNGTGGGAWLSGSPQLEALSFEGLGSELVNGGAVYVSGGSPTLTDCAFSDGSAAYGGQLYVTNAAVTLSACTFEGGQASVDGGAIYLDAATAFVDDCVVTDSSAVDGGAIYLAAGASLIAEGLEVTSSHGAQYGGALYAAEGALELSVTGSTFRDNTATYAGGGLFLYLMGTVALADTTFEQNVAYYGSGGAIYSYFNTALATTGCAFTSNQGYAGGAMYVYAPPLDATLAGDAFTGNLAISGDGGAVVVYYGSPIWVDGATFTGNAASNGGGALALLVCNATVTGSTFSQNQTTLHSGGAIEAWAYHYAYAFTAIGNRFEDNESGVDGGGLAIIDVPTVTLEGNTVVDNVAAGAGGGVYVTGAATLSARHDRIGSNVATYGGGLYVSKSLSTVETHQWTNETVIENTAEIGGGVAFVEGSGLALTNATIAGNRALEAAPALYLYRATADLRNLVVVDHADLPAVVAEDEESAHAATLAWSDLYGNAGGDLGGALDAGTPLHGVAVEPRFATWIPDGDETGDVLVPLRYNYRGLMAQLGDMGPIRLSRRAQPRRRDKRDF